MAYGAVASSSSQPTRLHGRLSKEIELRVVRGPKAPIGEDPIGLADGEERRGLAVGLVRVRLERLPPIGPPDLRGAGGARDAEDVVVRREGPRPPGRRTVVGALLPSPCPRTILGVAPPRLECGDGRRGRRAQRRKSDAVDAARPE